MALPRFFSRVNDSIGPLILGGAGGTDVAAFLADKTVLLRAPDDIEQQQFHVPGFLLLVNLCARLYPALRVAGPASLVAQARAIALRINPLCDFAGTSQGTASAEVAWCCNGSSAAISVAPAGWEVLIDLPDARAIHSTNMLASLAAGSLAAAALFRQLFAEFLPKGRSGLEPGRLNVLTLGPVADPLPDLPSDIPLGRVHLVGAGAVGQAAIYALARISATGSITVIDPEPVELPNLQRYVLTGDADEGASKCGLVERELANTRLELTPIEAPWSLDLTGASEAQTVCAAVDSDELRIALQAGLPQRLYNAWTQPDDIGWSRHERFGAEPCLACLYWPTHARPNYHEQVADALKQHELRVLGYLSLRIPVDQPLPQIHMLPNIPAPPDAFLWVQRPLLDDIALSLGIGAEELARWRGRELKDLYREGICAGALVRKQTGDVPVEMTVPLAHQSVLAGIMLATQLVVASHPDLVPYRPEAVESRLDLLASLPQIAVRPRQQTANCLCADQDFLARYAAKWPYAPELY